jgi:hypothetical protein
MQEFTVFTFPNLLRKDNRRRAKSVAAPSYKASVEALEDRLVLTWSGIPPATIQPPASSVAVTLDAQADATGTAYIASSEVDYYRLTAPTSGAYHITATTPSSNLDTVLGVFNSSGARIAYNDDAAYPQTTDSDLTVNLQAGSSYYFGITKYTGSPTGKYTWLVDGPSGSVTDDAYEENDTMAAAADLGTISALRTISNLVMADSADWYRFSITGTGSSSSYVSIASSSSQADLDLRVYDANGNQIGISESPTNNERVSLEGRAAGTYFVNVYDTGGLQTSPNYTLTVDPSMGSSTPPTTGAFDITLHLTGFTSSQMGIFNQAAQRWEQIITGDLPNATYNGAIVDDLLIDGSARTIDGRGGILGQAGPDRFRSGSYLPYHGSMEFDSADIAQMESSGQLLSVITHEMGHVLGFGTIWTNKHLLSGAGGSNPRFIGVQATAAYNQIFGRNETGVPVENTGGSGTRDSHWRESVFNNEIMTGWIDSGSNPISRITVASLADLGYTVNVSAADSYTPPGGATVSSSAAGSSGTPSLVAGNGFKSHSYNWHDLVAALTDNRFGHKKDEWTSAVDAFFASHS